MNTHMLRVGLIVVLAALFVGSLSLFAYANARVGMDPAGLVISSLILSIPLALLYFSIGLLIEAWLQHSRQGRVSGKLAAFLYYTPRVAGVLVALFTGLFALDVFDMEGSLWEKIGGFLIHAAPSIVMLGVLALAWRRPWIGALVFGLAALYFSRHVFGAFGNLLLFVLPMALVAVLFYLNWRWRGEIGAEG